MMKTKPVCLLAVALLSPNFTGRLKREKKFKSDPHGPMQRSKGIG
jgi:hypothetical protein